MAIRLTYQPLGTWPGERTVSPQSPGKFRSTLADALSLVEYELARVDAANPVLRVDVDLQQISRDGARLLAKPQTPGVVLEFDKPTRLASGTSQLVRASFPCDRYWLWETNVRAIGLTLEALRAVARYGATRSDEQYRGFLALPGPGGVNTTAVQLSPERAARILVDAHPSAEANGPHIRAALAASLLTMPSDQAGAFAREARAAAHPDRGGSADAFATVNAAYDVISRYHVNRRD
jgi:hypothetical protein